MKKITLVSVTACAFVLGFGLSEYLHVCTQASMCLKVPLYSKKIGPIHSENGLTENESTQKSLAENPLISDHTDNLAINLQSTQKIDGSIANNFTAKEVVDENFLTWEKIKQLVAQGKYTEAISLLKIYLNANPSSAQAWYLSAQLYVKVAQPSLAVESYFRYLKVENDHQKFDQTVKELKSYLLQLNETSTLFNNDFSWLIAQSDELLKYLPNDGELHIAMALLFIKQTDTYQAQYHALMAVNDPNTQKRAEEILAQLNGDKFQGNKTAQEITIPLTRLENQFIVNVTVEGNAARLLLDTGASLTGLSNIYTNKYPSLLKNLKPIRLNTASGSQNSYLFTVNDISIGKLVFSQHILTQLPMGNMSIDNTPDFDGLLGIDILGRFEFVIDQNAAVLHLKPRKN